MLKVLIADDEKKICRLIQMLVNWDELDMQLVGVANNGIDALKMVNEEKPDILITDICMPGCDGIEIIRQAREQKISMEVLIISGYADFAYAQSAIHYGVSEYLLKPIKQDELTASLKKLGARCIQEKKRIDTSNRLLQYMEDDNIRKRCAVFYDLLLASPRRPIPDRDEVNRQYLYHFSDGIFRVLLLKLDYDTEKHDIQSVRSIMLELEEILKAELKSTCNDMEIYKEECYCYILCNYEKENSHIFRKSVRYAIDQINAKRFRLWDARYSVAMGIDVDNTEKLYDSLDSCRRAMDNRLLEGGERLLDPPAVNNQFDCRELTEPYCRIFDKASDLCDEKIIAEGVEKFGTDILKVKNITGEDLLKAVMMIGTHAVNTLQSEEAHDQLILFRKKCGHCSTADQLFGVLENTLVQILQKKKQQFEEEERKPIRIAKQYMQNHYMEPITLELVADKVGFNSSYFSSFFKKETGAGFADYLIQMRMEKAKELLKDTKDTVKEVCEKVGYSDVKHFTSMFRKYTGLKPGEYRKLYG